MLSLTLRPMAREAYAVWSHEQVLAYADDKVETGEWEPDDARRRARRELTSLLPDGPATEHHDVLVAVLDAGTTDERVVGAVWVHVRPDTSPVRAFLYDIVVDQHERGRGLGRALLAVTEEHCRRRGAETVDLHVFAHNPAAVRLYESAGYETTDLSMRKHLARPAGDSLRP